MNLITPRTTAERDLLDKDARVLQVAEATHHLAAVIRNANAWFASLPVDRLLAVLNADIPVTLATLSHNAALGNTANAALAAIDLPEFPNRATVDLGRPDIVFDGTSFVYVAPEITPLAE